MLCVTSSIPPRSEAPPVRPVSRGTCRCRCPRPPPRYGPAGGAFGREIIGRRRWGRGEGGARARSFVTSFWVSVGRGPGGCDPAIKGQDDGYGKMWQHKQQQRRNDNSTSSSNTVISQQHERRQQQQHQRQRYQQHQRKS